MPRLRTNLIPEQELTEVDGVRALRTIRVLGALNLVLVVALAGSFWWGSRAADALRVNATLQEDNQPIKIALEARLVSDGKAIRNGDTVTDPTVTVRGILDDYARLREGLANLAVSVQGTRVDILPETGEFAQRVVLVPGRNQIDIGVWWEGREWQRTHAEVIYVKSQPKTEAETPSQSPL